MYRISLSWKEYNVDLTMVESWLRSNAGSSYTGNSAGTGLDLWFTEEPSQEIKDSIETYWNSLNEESEEASSYLSYDIVQNTIDTLKLNLHSKTWDEMSAAERKLAIGITPTRAELGL